MFSPDSRGTHVHTCEHGHFTPGYNNHIKLRQNTFCRTSNSGLTFIDENKVSFFTNWKLAVT